VQTTPGRLVTRRKSVPARPGGRIASLAPFGQEGLLVPLQVNRLWAFADLPSSFSARGLRGIKNGNSLLYLEINTSNFNILPLATRLGTS